MTLEETSEAPAAASPVPTTLSVWWDPAATLDAVLWRLRLTGTDPDRDALAALIPSAACLVEDFIDPDVPIPGPPPESALQTALETVTISLYHRDAIAATVGSVPASARTDDGFDPLADVRRELIGHKEQWGIG